MSLAPEDRRHLQELQHSMSTPSVGGGRRRRVAFSMGDLERDEEEELMRLVPPFDEGGFDSADASLEEELANEVFSTSPFGRPSPTEIFWSQNLEDILTHGRRHF